MRRGSRLCGGSWYSCTGIGNRDGGAFGGWRGVRSARGRLPSPAMLVVVFEGPCSRESGVAYQNYYPGSTRFLFTELFPNQNYKKSRYKTTERPQSAIVQHAAAVIMLHGIASSKPPLRRSSKAIIYRETSRNPCHENISCNNKGGCECNVGRRPRLFPQTYAR